MPLADSLNEIISRAITKIVRGEDAGAEQRELAGNVPALLSILQEARRQPRFTLNNHEVTAEAAAARKAWRCEKHGLKSKRPLKGDSDWALRVRGERTSLLVGVFCRRGCSEILQVAL